MRSFSILGLSIKRQILSVNRHKDFAFKYPHKERAQIDAQEIQTDNHYVVISHSHCK